MSCTCTKERDFSELDAVLDAYAGVQGSLIAILQKAQGIYGYLPTDVLQHVAKRTGIKAAKILGVATFYTQFRLKPVGKYLILLCQGTACHVLGSGGIEDAIVSFLSKSNATSYTAGETTSDGLFTLQNVACLGCCSLAPVMMINGETYGSLTPDKTRQILQSILDAESTKAGASSSGAGA